MARTKQTARKGTGGKPLAMAKGKGKGKPTPGRADRKVVLEYSSDETPDESAPQSAEGAEAPGTGEETDTPHSAYKPSPRHYYRDPLPPSLSTMV